MTRLMLILALASPAIATAQAPGYQQIDPRSIRAEYNAEVLDRINDVLLEWSNALSTDRADEIGDSYWENAVLIPPGGDPIHGREAIQEYFEGVVGDYGQVEAFMLDFDASGGMAQVFGNYMITVQRGPQAGSVLTGPVMTIYSQRGRRWRIRSQIFLPAVPPGGSG